MLIKKFLKTTDGRTVQFHNKFRPMLVVRSFKNNGNCRSTTESVLQPKLGVKREIPIVFPHILRLDT